MKNTASQILDRSQAPTIHDAVDFDFVLPPINQVDLDNGVPLYWLSAGEQDVFEIDWVLPAGSWQEGKPAISQAVAALLRNGTKNKTAQQIMEAIEFYGASLKVQPGNDYATLSLFGLTHHLSKLLPIVQELLMEATFPEDELSLFKTNSIQRLLINERKCEFVANQQIDVMLYGEEHPYGRYTKAEYINNFNREDLLDFYQKQYNLGQVKLFMTGKVGDKEVKLLNQHFGGSVIKEFGRIKEKYSTPEFAGKQLHLTNDEAGVQAAIRIGRHFPNRLHPDYAPMVILNTIFGGYFGSRLMSNIREEKGYTYGIYSSMVPSRHGGSFVIHTEVGRDVAEQAVKEIYFEMDKLCTEKVGEQELLLVKNYLLGSVLGHLDGPFELLQRWRSILLNGQTEEDFNNNIVLYKTIAAKDLIQLAQRYFDKKDWCEIVVV